MPSFDTDAPPRSRHLSASTMLWIAAAAVVLLILVPILPWLARGRERSRAVEELQKVGVHINFNYNAPFSELGRDMFGHTDAGPYFGSVEMLYLTGSGVTDAHTELAALFPEARRVYVYHTQITDKGASFLDQFAQATELNLNVDPASKSPMTRESIKHLRGMTSLETLTLDGFELTDEDLPAITGLPRLHTLLFYPGMVPLKITDAGIALIARDLTLKQLSLYSAPALTDGSWDSLASIKSLESLNINGTNLTGVGLGKLRHLPALQNLSWGVKTTDEDLAHIQHFPALTTFSVGSESITDAGIVQLPAPGRWRGLHFGGTKLTEASMKHLGKMTTLQSLTLGDAPLTDAGLSDLAPLTALWSLGLAGTKVSDAGIVHLMGMTDLNILDLSGTTITDAGLEQIAKLPNLSYLALNNCNITDAGLAHLNGHTTLRQLSLRETPITPAAVAAFRSSNPDFHYIDHSPKPAAPPP